MNARDPLSAAAETRHRLPTEPYPGLRPFLDFEEILLFGRERQVREVIDRLKETQFVAVIGGSGSGKSSLILAGVVPELRSFGIPGAGDFWVPLVCTPGTNAALADQQRRLDTPITRLARKFAALLRPAESPERAAERLADIEARLREERGLAKLVRQYSDVLQAPPGPDPKDARFLFVIDQFEELFHPTTRQVEDARLLVERVIDHFFSPHPRCFVVLTMRSEHLNDCAGFLELPDAINKASYLVRRLDENDLASAIAGPAARLLRLLQRAELESMRLPEAIQFDPDVVARLLHDVQAIVDDNDHLPLLQHALARTWEAAILRVRDRLDFPDQIVAADLFVAATTRPYDGATLPGPSELNVLRASLENWAEATYAQHDAAARAQLDAVLRRLALKDPNTGMYSQQRLRVDDGVRLLGPGGTREALRALLARGFLFGVDYLYWDAENPERITIKVSHESFIRGWSRLRGMIDDEAERYSEFVELLRKCEQWQRRGRPQELLLEAADLRRAGDAALAAVLADADERAAWFRRLDARRAFAHLRAVEPEADAFLLASVERQDAQVDRERRRKRNRRALWVIALLAVPPLLFWTVVQGPVIQRTSLMFKALSLANATPWHAAQPGVGAAAPALAQLVEAVEQFDRGRWGRSGLLAAVNRLVLDYLAPLPFVRRQAQFAEQVAAGAEPAVNGSLRQLLQTSLWHADAARATDPARQVRMAGIEGDVACDLLRAVDTGSAERVYTTESGRLLTARNPEFPLLSRSIFVPSGSLQSSRQLELWSARRVGDPARCVAAQELMRIPSYLKPQAVFDANLRFLTYVSHDRGRPTTTMIEIDWERTDDEGGRSVRQLPKLVLTGRDEAEHIARALEGDEVGLPGLLPVARATAGRTLVVDGQGWRMFDAVAQRLPDAPENDGRLRALREADARSACGQLGAHLQKQRQDGLKSSMLIDPADDDYCFDVARGRPPGGSGLAEQVVVAVYGRPSQAAIDAEAWPAAVASLPRFTRSVENAPITWKVGAPDSDLAGWIAAWTRSGTGQLRHVGAPWSTCALWRLGREVLAQQPGQPPLAPPPDGVCEGR